MRHWLFLTAVLSSGCQWVEREAILVTVWSDDGADQAYLLAKWQEESGMFGVPEGASTRNHRHYVYLRSADGSDRRDLYGVKPEHGFGRIYYMKSQGYVIVALQDGSGLRFVKAGTDGTERVVATSSNSLMACGSLEVIPSPDGAELAIIERAAVTQSPPSGPAVPVPACSSGAVTVELVDAATLNRLHGPFSWTVAELAEATWTPAGELFVASAGDAWRVDRQSGPVASAPPACFAPKTTSSNVSAGGVMIGPGNSGDPVRVISQDAASFGCQ